MTSSTPTTLVVLVAMIRDKEVSGRSGYTSTGIGITGGGGGGLCCESWGGEGYWVIFVYLVHREAGSKR